MRRDKIETSSIRMCGHAAPLVADQTVLARAIAEAAETAKTRISSASVTSPSVHTTRTVNFLFKTDSFPRWYATSCLPAPY